MGSKLKPCPFCGGEAFMQYDHRYPDDSEDGIAAFEVICTTFGCPIYRADNTYYYSEADAIKAWNRRTNNGNS